MDKKKILMICSIVLILASIIISIFLVVNSKEPEEEFIIEGIDLPKNKDVLKDANVGNLKITEVSLLTRNGMSSFKAKVSNETEEDIEVDTLYVVFYEDDFENKITALKYTTIRSNGDVYINIESESDLSNVTKIDYVME